MNAPGFSIGVDVFLFDPECRAEPIGHQFAARDQPPDLLLAEAQVRGGFFDRVKARHFSLTAVGGGGVRGHRIDPICAPMRSRAADLVSEAAASTPRAMTSRAACRAK